MQYCSSGHRDNRNAVAANDSMELSGRKMLQGISSGQL